MGVEHDSATPIFMEGKWYCSRCKGRTFTSKRAVNIHIDWEKKRKCVGCGKSHASKKVRVDCTDRALNELKKVRESSD